MSTCNSTPKPAKPYPDFPLFPHANGYWAKKIRQRLHYFGKWADGWQAALDTYNTQKEALHAGKKPREVAGELRLKDLLNDFLDDKEALVASGELSPRTLKDYAIIAQMLVKYFGGQRLVVDLGPDDFTELRNVMSKRWGLHRLGSSIQIVRGIFRFAVDKVDRVIRLGNGFKRPTAKAMRIYRGGQGLKLFTAQEVRNLVAAAGLQMRAIILLGINCGFGNNDCASLPIEVVDLAGGWIDFPRPKTGIARRCALWPETVDAIRQALADKPPDGRPQVFVTRQGNAWGREDAPDTPIGKEMKKLMKRLGIGGHRSFYALRHTFRTIADEAKDQPAADMIMGHQSPHISTVYRERIADRRLKAVSDFVRMWLLGKGGAHV
jgi:integrase